MMTVNRPAKKAIRAHMRSTGLSYMQAMADMEHAKPTATTPVTALTSKSPLTPPDSSWNLIPLGENDQEIVFWDVLKSNHILITGPTGSGKSVALHNILRHLMNHKDRWRIFAVDMKKSEFNHYYLNTSEFRIEVASNLEYIVKMLRNVYNEMLERYQKMHLEKVEDYAQLSHRADPMMVVIDEETALIDPRRIVESNTTDPIGLLRDEVVNLIIEIRRLGAKAGVYMVSSTQRISPVAHDRSLLRNIQTRLVFGGVGDPSGDGIEPSVSNRNSRGQGAFSSGYVTKHLTGYFVYPPSDD